MFWPFTVWINCSSDLKNIANSRPSASNFKSFARSLEQFFLTVGQNNFGKKNTKSRQVWSWFILHRSQDATLYDPNALIVPTDTIDVEPAPIYVEPIRYTQRHSEHFWHNFHFFFIWYGGITLQFISEKCCMYLQENHFKLSILFLHEICT